MEYQALYRKYRPQRFDEVVDQDHVTTTLISEIVEGKVAHAYLFAGPRGTGKTTTARLLAKALNCEKPLSGGEPCNDCPSCEGITDGTSLDVIELDAASHNKVEDIREIRINVGTVAAAAGARRVYILDEAHMLSRAAGNALLKTLEEPPAHVVFVLATTEPYKLLDTIRSRAQRFDFHPVATATLAEYAGEIARREGIVADAHALGVVAQHARGSVRDALSLLEQVAALGDGKVEAAAVTRALGLADEDAFGALAEAVRDRDAPGALGLVATLASQGADLRRFVADAVGFFRGVFLAQYAPNLEAVTDEPAETLEEWRRHAGFLSASDVLRAVDQLSDALFHLRQGREERLVVELALLRLVRPETAPDVDAVASRLDRLEARVRDIAGQVALGSTAGAAAPTSADTTAPAADEATSETGPPLVAEPVAPSGPGGAEPPAEPTGEHTAVAENLDLAAFESVWPSIVAGIREHSGPRRHALLKEARPVAVERGVVTLEVPAHLPFHLEQLRADEDLQAVVIGVAAPLLGGAIELRFSAADGDGDDGGEAASPERAPEASELLDEGTEGADPEALVVDILGGEVVSE